MLKNIHAGGIDKNGHVTVMHRSGGTSGILADYVNNAIKKEPDIYIYIYILCIFCPEAVTTHAESINSRSTGQAFTTHNNIEYRTEPVSH